MVSEIRLPFKVPGLSFLLRFVPERIKVVARRVYVRFFLPPLETLPLSPDLFRQYRRLLDCGQVKREPGGWCFEGKFYPDYLTMGGASHAIFPIALRFCRGRGIDVGAGFWPLPGATAVDSERGPGLSHRLTDFPDHTLDYVFSSHCLEHIEDWRGALSGWIAKIKPGGMIFLYLPHPDCAIWRPGSPFVGDNHKWAPDPETVKRALRDMDCEIVDSDDGPDAMYSFFVCACKAS